MGVLMDDRITEIREALDYLDGTLGSHVYRRDIQPLAAAARVYADLLDSGALIIRRDENGEWPEWATAAVLAVQAEQSMRFLHPSDYLDALASSQGVEPQ